MAYRMISKWAESHEGVTVIEGDNQTCLIDMGNGRIYKIERAVSMYKWKMVRNNGRPVSSVKTYTRTQGELVKMLEACMKGR